jgi:hypothetical protein
MSKKSASWRPFNINEYARVKLSPEALLLWKQRAEQMRAAFPKMAHLWPDDPPLDANGHYREQLYQIMHLVAPLLVPGASAFENCIIELEFSP